MKPISETDVPTRKELLGHLGYGEYRSPALSSAIRVWSREYQKKGNSLRHLKNWNDVTQLQYQQLASDFVQQGGSGQLLWPTGSTPNYSDNKDR